MAVAMGTMVHQTAPVTDLKEFVVPKFLSVNLKKKVEDRSMNLETGNFCQKNGADINKNPNVEENVKKNSPDVSDLEISPAVDSETAGRAEEDVIEMAPNRVQDKGGEKQSYLLQPFLKPVAENVERNASENPILKALFVGGATRHFYNWISGDTPASNNCHPFKKNEFSRDLVNSEAPVQVPKSLTKSKDKSKSSQPAKNESGRKPEDANTIFKELDVPLGNGQTSSSSSSSLHKSIADKGKARKTDANFGAEKENKKPQTADVALVQMPSKTYSKSKIISQTSFKSKSAYVNSEKLMQLRSLVDNAIKSHKIYSMTGSYNSVRKALKQRGWIEKIDSDVKGKRKQNRFEDIGIYDAAFQFVQKFSTVAAMRFSLQSNSGFLHNDQINYSGQGEAEIINRMLRNINEDLCWLSRPYPCYCWKDIDKFDLVNRLPKSYFSNKIGLCNSLQQIQWYFEPGVCSTQYPRTYNMSQKEEYEAFKEDFRITACINLLKWLTQTYRAGGERAVRSVDGKIDVCIVDFAIKKCSEYVKYRDHEDIDLPDVVSTWDYQWDSFLMQYYKIINDGYLLKECKSDSSVQALVTSALAVLNLIKPYWPQINIDGYQNFWVVKPGGRCCGNGIVIKNNLDQILVLVNPSITRETRYVVQKYIERPLLIYNTKFDIRQWFLVTNVYPLTVWMYRESYLRFCSQPFSLKNTHESIHLCNNAVQKRYKNSKRDRGLPDENMWDCYTFKTYLKSMGHPDAWDKYIYPGMKEGFVGALLASQDTMERRKNCFELYGADFMISDTLTDGPWLIEINSNPAMDSSTSVTARMCPQVLEDIVKVVIDRRDDKNASTGGFEMVYKQQCPPVPPYLGMSLSIKGQKVHNNLGEPRSAYKKSKIQDSSEKLLQHDSEDRLQSGDHIYPRFSSIVTNQTLKNENNLPTRYNFVKGKQEESCDSSKLSVELVRNFEKEMIQSKLKLITKSNHEMSAEVKRKLTFQEQTKETLCTVKGECILEDELLFGKVHRARTKKSFPKRKEDGLNVEIRTARVQRSNNVEESISRKKVNDGKSAAAIQNRECSEEHDSISKQSNDSFLSLMKETSQKFQGANDIVVRADLGESNSENSRSSKFIHGEESAAIKTSSDSSISFKSIQTNYLSCTDIVEPDKSEPDNHKKVEKPQPFIAKQYLDMKVKEIVNEQLCMPLSIKKCKVRNEKNEPANEGKEFYGTPKNNSLLGISSCNEIEWWNKESKVKIHSKSFNGTNSVNENHLAENGRSNRYDFKSDLKKSLRKKTRNVVRKIEKKKLKTLKGEKTYGVQKGLGYDKNSQETFSSAGRKTKVGDNPSGNKKIVRAVLPKKVSVAKKSFGCTSEEYELICRKQLLKMLHAMGSKNFIKEVIQKNGKIINKSLAKASITKGIVGDQYVNRKKQNSVHVLERDGKSWQLKSGKDPSASEERDGSLADARERSKRKNQNEKRASSTDNEEDIKSMVQTEISDKFDVPEEKEDDGNLGFSVQKNIKNLPVSVFLVEVDEVSHESASCPDFQGTFDDFLGDEMKSTLDGNVLETNSEKLAQSKYNNFPELKKNIEVVRRACNEILKKLKDFNESNSKVKLQRALKKEKEMSKEESHSVKAYTFAGNIAKMNGDRKQNYRRRNAISKRDETPLKWESSGFANSKSLAPRPLTLQKERFCRHIERTKKEIDSEIPNAVENCVNSPKSESSLAISSETGAVRNVGQTLPKIHKWPFWNKTGFKSSAPFTQATRKRIAVRK